MMAAMRMVASSGQSLRSARAVALVWVAGCAVLAWALRLRWPAAEAPCGSPEREAGLPVNFDTLAGVTGRHHQVNHSEVVRLRHAKPDESLEMLAHRLGCYLSTVKKPPASRASRARGRDGHPHAPHCQRGPHRRGRWG